MFSSSSVFYSFYQRLRAQLSNRRTTRYLALCLTIAALVSSVATYGTISATAQSNFYGPNLQKILGLILTDLILFLTLAVLVTRRMVRIWMARKHAASGSRLQTRIVLLFSIVAVVPTIIVAVFSTVFFNIGIQAWFDERVKTALAESVEVAQAYFQEHQEVLRGDILAMAHDIERQAFMLRYNTRQLEELIQKQITIRGLTEAIVFERGHVLAQTNLSFSGFVRNLQPELFEQADKGKVAIITLKHSDTVRAIVRLEPFTDTYLLVGRFVDPRVIKHMERTLGATKEYQLLTNNISRLQIQFSAVFVIVALLLLLAAVWVGILFASGLARPISQLVQATNRIKAGDLSARVHEGPENDEIGILQRGFNQMSEQLQAQRKELLHANQEIDTKRKFNEMVLEDVSAGIMVLDSAFRITLINRSASSILGFEDAPMLNAGINDLFPSLMPMLTQMMDSKVTHLQDQLQLKNAKISKTLLVRLARDQSQRADHSGFLVTFDDISELIAAQRSAVWSDVARRIAHEIKNPLTPVQLASERIAKRFGKEVSDPEMLHRYTDTITRHVNDIARIVEEFVNFARMPVPKLVSQDIVPLVREIALSQASLSSRIRYILDLPEAPINVRFDAGLLSQLLVNLLKNAEESLLAGNSDAKKEGILEEIKLSVARGGDFCIIKIQDNGKGFPDELMDRLTEPYMTTRARGTGLGLAIVKKIVEDHGGDLTLSNNPEGGACVEIHFLLQKNISL